MKVGTYTRLGAPLLGFAMLWTSAACGSRTSLLLEEDAGVTSETPAQESNTGNSGGRAGSSTTGRAGRGASAGAGGTTGSTATGGRAGRAGRGGEAAQQPRGGAGGRAAPQDRDAAADSGEDEEQPSAGSGGEEAGGSGGEQAGAGGEAGGAGGASGEGAAGEPAAGSGGSDAGPADAGAQVPVGDRLTALTPEQTTEICGRIESATANVQWNEAVRGWCARGALGTPECTTSQESCVNGSMILPICSQTVPDCPDITIDEFVTCRTDELLSFVEYNRTISCDTPPGQPGEPEVASCVGPYQRCAPLSALAR